MSKSEDEDYFRANTTIHKMSMNKTYVIMFDPNEMKRTPIRRAKTWLWNRILPPHIRLELPEDE